MTAVTKIQSRGINWALFVLSALSWSTPRFLAGQTQWAEDGKFLGSTGVSTAHVAAAPDGHGGVFFAWEARPASDKDIYINWLDASGSLRWGTGVAVISAAGNQRYATLAPDGSGGVYAAWEDTLSGDLFIQRFDSTGAKQWGTDGLSLCNKTGEQSQPRAESDGAGGVIVVWQDKRNGSSYDLYAQRMNSAGVRQWDANDVAVCTAVNSQSSHAVASDNAGGVMIVWQDNRQALTNSDIYVQRVNASGSAVFVSNGKVLCDAAGNQMTPRIAPSGTRWVVCWDDSRSASSDIYSQAVDAAGGLGWTGNGVAVCTAANAQYTSRVVGDGLGGAIVAWCDTRAGYDIYAQRVSAAGAVQWTADGAVVNASAGYQYSPEAVADGSQGAIVVWNDNETGSDIELYAQRINGSGTRQWGDRGLPVVTRTGSQQNQTAVSDGSGGMITLWQDGRTAGKADVYGMLTNDVIAFTGPVAGERWRGDQAHTITWTNRFASGLFHHLAVRASVVPGDNFPVTVNANVSKSAVSLSWTPSTVNSENVRLKIQAVNDKGLVADEYLSPLFIVDSTPPAAFNLVSPADNASDDPTPTFTWQATTDNLSGAFHYELWVDSNLLLDNLTATSVTLTEGQKLSNGLHTWTVRAVDAAGLVRTAGQTWRINTSDDQSAPNAFSLTAPADNVWVVTSNPAFQWQATTDVGIAGLAKYQLFVDNALKLDNIPAGTTSTSSAALTMGTHTWYVNAVDNAGNVRKSTQTWTVKVDSVKPAAFALSSPANEAWTSDTTPVLSWTASSDAGSQLAKYQLIVNGAVRVDNIAPSAVSLTLPDAQALAEGSYTWSIRAFDNAGNSRTSTAAFVIGVDATKPTAPVPVSPANGTWVNQSLPTFTWNAATDSRSGIQSYQLYVDGSARVSGITGTSVTLTTPLADGSHTWYVRALDRAGNGENSVQWGFNSDATPPEAFTLIAPASGSTIHTNKPTYRWHSTSDARSQFQKFEFYLDGSLKVGFLGLTDTTLTLTDALANGTHKWKVLAYDVAGNVQSSAEWSFTVQISAPQITSPATASATEDMPFSYTATATDADGDALTFQILNASPWLTSAGAVVSGTPAEQDHSGSFTVSVSDGIFTSTKAVTVTVQQVNDPPAITSPLGAIATEKVLFTYTASATDPENDTVTFEFRNLPGWLSVSGTNQVKGTPDNGTPNGTFTLVASDGTLTNTKQVSVLVNQVNDAPVITSGAAAPATEHQKFTYTATAVDADGDPLTFSFQDYPAWMSFSGAVISGTPGEGQGGSHTFRINVTDGFVTSSKVVTVTVTPVNDPPVISSPATAAATEHQAFSYTAAATDPEGATIRWDFIDHPDWLSHTGAVISGTPPENGPATVTFKIVASDGSLASERVVTVTVTPVNDPPVITSPATAAATEHQAFSYTAAATDPEGATIRWDFIDHPDWLSHTGAVISGTPPERVPATVTFKIVASDGSLASERVVTVTVTLVNDPPVITSPATAAATEHQAFSYTAAATDPEGTTIEWDFIDHPLWLTHTGAVISGTPPENEPPTITFKIVASDQVIASERVVTVTITPVNDPPVNTSPATASATEHQPFTYTAAGTDPEGTALVWDFTDHPVWLSHTGAVLSGTPPEGVPASFTFKAVASDGSLTSERQVTVTVTLVNDAPVIASPATAAAVEHQEFSYTAVATDPEGTTIKWDFTDHPLWLTHTGAVISGTPPENEHPTITFRIVASDGSLSSERVVTVTITPVNDPPVFACPDTVTAVEDVRFIYTARASDPEADTFRFTFLRLPSWLRASDSTATGMIPENAVDTCFVLAVTDSRSASDTMTVFVRVQTVNDPPRVTSPDTAEAFENQLFSYTATAFDVDGPHYSIRFTDVPDWLTASGPMLSGVPKNGPPTASFSVIVNDGSLSDTLAVTVLIRQVNDPPSFVMPFPNPSFGLSETLQWQLVLNDYITDPDDPDTSLFWTSRLLDSVRVGISIHQKTGTATFLGFNVDKNFRVLFTVRDKGGLTASDTLYIRILGSGVEAERIGAAPDRYTLYGNYPNPFNPQTTLRYGLPKPGPVRLRVLNLRGQVVATLVDGRQAAGVFEVTWRTDGEASGLYFAVIEAEGWKKVQRMMLVR
ncbi:MAG: putative Ig domain-containing protein [bacterium]|nr:putative Ig domain-containing protein [bacterium]